MIIFVLWQSSCDGSMVKNSCKYNIALWMSFRYTACLPSRPTSLGTRPTNTLSKPSMG